MVNIEIFLVNIFSLQINKQSLTAPHFLLIVLFWFRLIFKIEFLSPLQEQVVVVIKTANFGWRFFAFWVTYIAEFAMFQSQPAQGGENIDFGSFRTDRAVGLPSFAQ